MVDLFILQVIAAFIVGGAYIALSILAAEKIGSRAGGILIGLPSTGLVGLFFIGYIQGVPAALEAIPVMPITFAINGLFLVAFALLAKYGEKKALAGAAVVWTAIASPLAFLKFSDLGLSVVGAAILASAVLLYFRKIKRKDVETRKASKKEFIARAVFSGLVVALAVVLSKAFGPVWGGLLVSFPGATTSSLYLLSRKHGTDFATSVSKSMPIGGLGSIVFLVSAFFLMPAYGLAIGILTAYLICAVATFGLAQMLKSY